MAKFNYEEVKGWAEEFEHKRAEELLSWALNKFHPKIALASSFGAEDVVLIDMLWRIRRDARIFTIDTGRLPQETYDLLDEVRKKYGIKVEVLFPDTNSIESMLLEHGANLFYHSVELRTLCCNVRKVEPLKRALAKLDAWITGLRREQSPTRKETRKVELDVVHGGIVKINPIADWTWKQVWDYIRANNVPYNKLHDLGYPSIGCAPCTRAIKPGEDQRAGRWWWEQKANKECGLHYNPLAKKLQKKLK
jgi:phosphoadenosine phosphosulfate reductase